MPGGHPKDRQKCGETAAVARGLAQRDRELGTWVDGVLARDGYDVLVK
jgi:hypothetical protein